MRVMVAMSGGVDSSVAAALMQEGGHDVIGVTLKLWEGPDGEAPTAGCCTVSDAEDARRVAAQLDIPYYVLDYTDHFGSGVVGRFVDDYLRGRTPNPCVECNRTVKFSSLLEQAEDLGCDVLATGHYARAQPVAGGWRLLRGADPRKDQSYVLSMLGQDQLARVRFPVGELDKAATRRLASELGLRTAGKKESQDICFVGKGDYRDFLRRMAPGGGSPGPIVTAEGEVVGRHQGVATVTIGQRRGLGLSGGEPRFVVDVDPERNRVVVGPRAELLVDEVELEQVSWVWGSPPDGGDLSVQYRAHGDAVPVRLRVEDEAVRLLFDAPQEAVAPGQTAAIYRDDEVLGGGVIRHTRPLARTG